LSKKVNALFYSECKGVGSFFTPGGFYDGIILALYSGAARRLCCGKIDTKFGDPVEGRQII
jgi:hypothetical protein